MENGLINVLYIGPTWHTTLRLARNGGDTTRVIKTSRRFFNFKYEPSLNAKKYGLEDSYLLLDTIILKQATKTNTFGIVDK